MSKGTQPEAKYERGESLGRYVILDRIGTGAMGVVYCAYDPQLARQVAVKVVRPKALARQGAAAARLRLLREAQALAQLSHPNVVSVYDVGSGDESHGGDVYIAMELVRGDNLRAWQREHAPTWREVVRIFIAAGRGLAAAHKLALVHRDFKPENVLVADDGRVCVTDFGLARPDPSVELSPPDAAEVPAAASRTGVLGVTLTLDGDAVGTPAYMAPEQHGAGEADARSDQYAFCVALYEALYGARPFEGESERRLAEAKASVEPELPALHRSDGSAEATRVPKWLRNVLRRGLSRAARHRYPTMAALLAELESGASGRAGRMVAIGLVAASIAAVGVLATRAGGVDVVEPCDGAGQAPDDAWADSRRAAVRGALEEATLGSADVMIEGVLGAFGAHVESWGETHREICERTWVRGEQSAQLLDARMQCLATQWGQIDALAQVLAEADATVAERALDLAATLPDPTDCLGYTEEHGAAVPDDADAREQHAHLRGELTRAWALRSAGRTSEGLAVVERLRAQVEALAWPSLTASMLVTYGALQDDDGRASDADATLRAGLAAAREAGDAKLEAEAWMRLSDVAGYAQHDFARGRFYARMGAAAADAMGGDVGTESWAETRMGTFAFLGGDDEAAEAHFRSALQLRRELLGDAHVLVASSWNNLGGALMVKMDLDGAEDALRESLKIRERALGDDHPAVAESVANLGMLALERGAVDEAVSSYRRARDILAKHRGESHPAIAQAEDGLGQALLARGDLDEAEVRLQRAQALYAQAYDETHPAVGATLINRAKLVLERGEPAVAIEMLRRALEILHEDNSAPARRAEARFLLGVTLADTGQDGPEARALIEHARREATTAGEAGEAQLAEIGSWLAAKAETPGIARPGTDAPSE